MNKETSDIDSNSDKPSLPTGWLWVTLQDIAKISGGITKGKKRRHSEKVRMVPYLRVANVQRGYFDLSEVKEIEATESEIEALRLQPGDILFNEGGDRDKLGRGWVWNGELDECVHQNHVFRARVLDPKISPKFISFYANSEGQRYFMEHAKQTTNLASINLTKLSALPIPLPPVAEQCRIVAQLEKHFTRLEAGVATLRRVQVSLKHYRTAVLKAACEGGLVPRITKWHFKHLGDVSAKIGSGSTPRGGSSVYRDSGTPLIRSMNVHSTGFRFDGLVFIDETEANRLKNVTVATDDVLLNITGASIGRVTTAPQSVDGARVNQHVCIIRPKGELLPKFLALFLASPKQQLCIANVQVGATRQALTKNMIMNWKVPIPSLTEQTLIIEEVERRLSVVDGMESVVSTNLQRAKHVRRGILNKAFTRELTEPDSNDEPVGQLLAKMLGSQQKNHKPMPKAMIKRIESPKTTQVRSVLEVLIESAEGHTPEALFAECGRDSTRIEEVEQFFAELRSLHESKKIIEVRKDASTVFLQAAP